MFQVVANKLKITIMGVIKQTDVKLFGFNVHHYGQKDDAQLRMLNLIWKLTVC